MKVSIKSASRSVIRVAYVVHTFDAGGLERIVAHLVNSLDRERFRPMIVCLDRSGDAARWITRDDVPVLTLHKRPGNSLRVVRQLAAAIREHRVDLIHTHNWCTLLEGTLACRWVPGARQVHAEHGLELDEFRVVGWKRAVRRLAMGWAFRRVDAVVAIAESVRRWIEKDFSLPRGRMHRIFNGVAEPGPLVASHAAEFLRQLGLAEGAIVVGSVGRLVSLKDFAGAVRAMSLLARSGHDVHFVLIGDGPERERIAAEAQAAGIKERVHLIGHQADPLPWLRILDVYINSSRTEAMNMGILEAMAVGLPVIATDVGDAAVMLGGAHPVGRIVPPRDPKALAEAVGGLMCDVLQRKKCAENSRNRYCASYTVALMVQRYADLYQQLCGQEPGDAQAAMTDATLTRTTAP